MYIRGNHLIKSRFWLEIVLLMHIYDLVSYYMLASFLVGMGIIEILSMHLFYHAEMWAKYISRDHDQEFISTMKPFISVAMTQPDK